MALLATTASAAGAHHGRDDEVADLHAPDVFADRVDDARGLVAVDGGKLTRISPFHVVDVRMADHAGLDPDHDLTARGRGEFDLLDRERGSEFAADGGFHGRLLPWRGSRSEWWTG
jgi:hypothetical protein